MVVCLIFMVLCFCDAMVCSFTSNRMGFFTWGAGTSIASMMIVFGMILIPIAGYTTTRYDRFLCFNESEPKDLLD